MFASCGFVRGMVGARPYEIPTVGFATVVLNFLSWDRGHFVACNRLFELR
jgi:hypothetical protein